MVKFSTLGKENPNLEAQELEVQQLNRVNIEHSERVTKKLLRNVFMLTVVLMATVQLMIGIL